MPVLGKSKEINKKDMNFFSEFTASAARMARMMFYGVVLVVALIAVIAILIIVQFIANTAIKSEINNITAELQSDKYVDLDVQAMNLAQTISEKNQYYYALSEMRNNVDQVLDADVELASLIEDNIPNDAYITQYSVDGSTVSITGYTFNYYTAVQYVNLLNENNVFTKVPTLSTEIVGSATFGDADMTLNPIDRYYSFSIIGSLTQNSYISVSKYINGDTVTAVGGIDTTEYATGDTFEYTEIATIEENGQLYNLVNVTIDGVGVSADTLESIIANDTLTGTATKSMNIVLFYTAAVAEEGGEA